MKLGQYELLSRIAVGGMAEIYRGRSVGEEGFEKPVVIKRILPEFASDTRFVEMLVAEARIHAGMAHRNIVQIHDLGISEDGEYFIVFEFIDGRDLGGLLTALGRASSPGRPGRLSDAVALYIASEMAEGVHFAHDLRGSDGQPLGIVHRDISPTNVLVSYAGEVKLADFGLAKRRTDHSVVVSIKGKLPYMSPEQARHATLDRRSDIFALGAVLYELLTGYRLRDVTNEVEGWQQVASGLIPSPRRHRPDLPPVLDRLLASALAPNPSDRFADAAMFAAACRHALDLVPRARASEAAELASAMRTLLPPGSPREEQEPSKLVRLKSEFLAPGAPRSPYRAPPPPPPAPRRALTPTRLAPYPTRPPDRPHAATAEASLRPTPPAPMPAVSAALLSEGRRTPAAPFAALMPAESRRTPAAPFAAALPPPLPGLARRTPSVPWSDLGTHSDAARSTPSPSPPSPARRTGQVPVQEPWPGDPAPALGSAPPRRTGAPNVVPQQLAIRPRTLTPFVAGGSARVARKPWLARVLMGMLMAVGAGAAIVHFGVIPLPLVAVWLQPAQLQVMSQPEGAEVYLDGQLQMSRTPASVTVRRDRKGHAVEVRKSGFVPMRQSLRFDKSRNLAVSLVLPPRSQPVLEQLPGAAKPAEAEAPGQPPAAPEPVAIPGGPAPAATVAQPAPSQ